MRVGRRTSALVAALLIAGTGFAFAAQALDVTISAIVAGDVTGTVQWAMPQGRVGATETNDDTDFYFTIRTSSDLDDVILQTIPASSLLTTDVDGTFATTTNLVVTPGTYDVGFKGSQHLTRVLDDVTLTSGNNVLNFTQTDNSAPKGSQVLLAGDVNGAGTTPATLGDDVVNAVDISTLLAVLDDDDLTGNGLRPNLNQDVVVNSVDLSLMISNLDEEGEN
ncbi:hypothetical protein A2856_01300 [Candidatus Uhrbacteria bacterium RIFCSPHIGHO2_01_FULL_63_20]|uniref:Dockerin domain-containing protein n=1 Tax=Candidatus Uhrbacteria bacterium RIFCSPHIGHO2_01_FULL_63_20 TaxID=1802385 RepID=A0A1F7TP65_9BACT|nr:MAG: hypothetical protein A2856_01300 [Candidatus Uhrbacteria bacterium RIFCSPHIGHO2_01_FULL_63_20]